MQGKSNEWVEFRRRAKEALPHHHVAPIYVGSNYREMYRGENIVWTANKLSKFRAEVFHTDKHCHNFPEKAVNAYPSSFIERNVDNRMYPDPCDHCVAEGFGE